MAVVALVGASSAACGGPTGADAQKSTGTSAKQGGTYNYPLSVQPRPFDPYLVQVGSGDVVLHQLYEGLTRWEEQPDGTLKSLPCLAESWSASRDATVWTVRLRRGVMFQPPVSREVTAADVVADLRYLADRANRLPAITRELGREPTTEEAKNVEISYQLVDIQGTDQDGFADPGELGVEALGRYTVRFTLRHPYSGFPEALGEQAFWVWPADYMQKVGVEAYARQPVGTGPYKFLRQVAGRSIDLVRNPRWWDSSGGPYIDTIHYIVLGNRMPTLAFQKGTIDWTAVPKNQAASSRSLPQVQSGQWKAENSRSLLLQYLNINMRDPVVGGTTGLRLRQALTYGCDRQAVVEAWSDGVDQVPVGLVPSSIPGAGKVREPYPYDPAKAAELVKQMGPVTLQLVYPASYRIVAETLAASYAKIGITIKLLPLEGGQAMELIEKGKVQLSLYGWFADNPSMDNFLYPQFHSSNTGVGVSTFYSNVEVDALLDKARATMDRRALQLYVDAERQILADAPVVPLWVDTQVRLLNNRVANVHFSSMGWVDLWRAWVK